MLPKPRTNSDDFVQISVTTLSGHEVFIDVQLAWTGLQLLDEVDARHLLEDSSSSSRSSPSSLRLLIGELEVHPFMTLAEAGVVEGSTLTALRSRLNAAVVACSTNGTATLWNVATGVPLQTFSCDSLPFKVALAPDGTFLLTHGGSGAQVWSVASGRCVKRIPAEDMRSVAISPDSRWFLTASELPLTLWSICSEESREFDVTGAEESSSIADDDPWHSADSDSTMDSHDLRAYSSSGHVVKQKKASMLSSAVFSKDGATVIASDASDPSSGHASLWCCKGLTRIRSFETSKPISLVHASPANDSFTALGEQELCIFNVSSGQLRFKLLGCQLAEYCNDGSRLLVLHSDRTGGLYDAYTGERLLCWQDIVRTATWSPDAKTIAAAVTTRICLWSSSTGEVAQTVKCAEDRLRQLLFAADGSTLVAQTGFGGALLSWPTSPFVEGAAAHRLAENVVCMAVGWTTLGAPVDSPALGASAKQQTTATATAAAPAATSADGGRA
mmetsp:Transcript_87261/g.191784  ORF Transcript_87261/g.191784 Transcript_87261/m.191784 type:complete len:501 (-) Transcript_87261:799-2301(-)